MGASNDNVYFVGQGRALLAPRVSNGALNGGFYDVGDVDGLQISFKQKFVDVFENETGYGLQALHAPVEVEAAVKLSLRQWNTDNLMTALWGTAPTPNPGGTVTSEAINGFVGLQSFLSHMEASSASVQVASGSVSAVTMTASGTGATSGTTVSFPAPAAGGVQATGTPIVSGGGVTGVNITNPGVGYSGTVTPTFTGVTGASGTATLGGALTAGTDYTLDGSFGSIELLATGKMGSVPPSTTVPLSVNYMYAATNGSVGAFTAAPLEQYLMIKANNTANPFVDQAGSAFAAVRVQVYRVMFDMTKMMEFIQKKDGVLELDGAVLIDTTVPFEPGNPRSVLMNIEKA